MKNMDHDIHHFIADEHGAVTSDWLVLTGVAFLLAAAIVVGVRDSAVTVGDQLDSSLDQATLEDVGDL